MTGTPEYSIYVVPHGLRVMIDGRAVADIRLTPKRMLNFIGKAMLEWGKVIAERCGE